MNNKPEKRLSFLMYLEARLGKVTVDYQAMTAKQLQQYIDVRRQYGEKPTHKVSLEEIEAIYQSKLPIEEITPILPTQVKTLKMLRAQSC